MRGCNMNFYGEIWKIIPINPSKRLEHSLEGGF